MSRADDLIERLQSEIAKRDARIAELEAPMLAWAELDYTKHTRRSLTCYIGQQNFRITAQENQLAALKSQPSAGVVPDQDGSAAQKSFWAGFEASVCGFNGLNIRAAWNEFKSSEQFKRLNPCRTAVPDGYVLAPVEPTRTMLEELTNGDPKKFAVMKLRYAAMLAAAQQKESGDE